MRKIQMEPLAHSKGPTSALYYWVRKPHCELQKSKSTFVAQMWGVCWGGVGVGNGAQQSKA